MFDIAPDTIAILWTDFGFLVLSLLMMKFLDVEGFAERVLFGSFAAILMANYVVWRWTNTLSAPELSLQSLWQYLYCLFESIGICDTFLSIFILLRCSNNSLLADRQQHILTNTNHWPAVDIFICTYNEPLDVLEKSILLAKAMDYPNKRIFVLDDTRRSWLADYCHSLEVFHITRPDNSHAKAGNLNSGLRASAGPDQSPLILVLDADFAPHANFLRRTVGLFRDPRIGLVQTPQHYFNADPIQHNLQATNSWIDDQRVFFDVFEPAKDAWDAAFCVGTSFVVRRDRLEEIGGFPCDAVSEDLNLTINLLRHGYITRWLNEPLSTGLAAEGLPEYISQRARWCLGTIQVALLKTSPLRASGFGFMHRLQFFHGLLNWCCKPFILLMVLAPMLYWYCDIPAFNTDVDSFLRYAMPTIFVFYLHSIWITRKRTLPLLMEVTHLVSAMAVTWTLITCFYRPFGRPFKVTDKGGDRSQVIIRWNMLRLFAAVLFLLLLAIFWNMFGPTAPSELSPMDRLNLFWAACSLLLTGTACLVCFERPRRHREELFRSQLRITARIDNRTYYGSILHLSTFEAHLKLLGGLQVKPGSKVEIALPDHSIITGLISTQNQDEIKLVLQLSEEERRRIIVALYRSPNDNLPEQASFRGALAGIVKRCFNQD